MSKGFSFENKVVEYFRSQGYLAKRGIPLTTESKQDATDIDVYGTKFIYPFIETTLICDCKNKAKPRPFERIFWTKGVAEYVRVNNTYVALPKVQTDVNKFAIDINVNLLSNDEINKFEGDNFSYGLNKIDDINSNIGLKSIYSSIKQLYIYRNPYTMLNRCINNIKLISEKIKTSKEDEIEYYKFILSELVVVLSVSILRVCSKLMSLDKKYREGYLLDKLTYGEMPLDKAKSIIEGSSRLALEVIKRETGIIKYSLEEFDFIRPPEYSKDLIGLIFRAMENPKYYVELPQNIDYIMFEVFMNNKNLDDEEFKNIFGSENYNEKIKSCKNIIYLINHHCGSNIDICNISNKN